MYNIPCTIVYFRANSLTQCTRCLSGFQTGGYLARFPESRPNKNQPQYFKHLFSPHKDHCFNIVHPIYNSLCAHLNQLRLFFKATLEFQLQLYLWNFSQATMRHLNSACQKSNPPKQAAFSRLSTVKAMQGQPVTAAFCFSLIKTDFISHYDFKKLF